MADVTISSLPIGTPSGNALLPYSTGSSTLGAPVSGIFENTNKITLGNSANQDVNVLTVHGNLSATGQMGVYITGQNTGLWFDSARRTGIYSSGDPFSPAIGQNWIGFRTSNIDSRMIINSAGDISIGYNGLNGFFPKAKLDVNGNIAVNGKQISNGPSFGVSADGGSQTIVAGTPSVPTRAKLTILTTTSTPGLYYWDTNSCWDNTNKRFTPNVPGYYIFNATVAIAGLSTGANVGITIAKNNTDKSGFRFNNGGVNDAYCNTSVIYYMNGTTDYVELYVINFNNYSVAIRSEAANCWFDGGMLRNA